LKKRDSYPGAVDAAAMGAGVLHAAAAATRFRLARYDPPADLAAFVDFFWVVRWDLRGEPPHEQAILPHPNVNLAFEVAGAAVFGVDRTIFTRRLTGAGKALGVRFRPGGFRPFYSAPIFTLNDHVVPAQGIFGQVAERAAEAVMAAGSDEAMTEIAAGLLRGASPRPDPVIDQVAAAVTRITADPGLRRVAQLADACGIPERRLQRLFAEYVGVPPKWVMRRARLHEAALRAETGGAVDWAALAADLGYADQAHLTRDFTATLGVPPSQYTGRR
jgi:AraC-like DNA-binding protein